MLENFPSDWQTPATWTWKNWQPYYNKLLTTELTRDNLDAWLRDWTRVSDMFSEVGTRLRIAADVDTSDDEAKEKYIAFNNNLLPHAEELTDKLNRKLVDSGLSNEDIAVPLRNLKAAVEIFHPDNLPILTEINNMRTDYSKLRGDISVNWQGEEKTTKQMSRYQYDLDRTIREKAWRLTQEAILEKKGEFDVLWKKYMQLRKQIVDNSGLESYRDYAWKKRNRHDYTPDDVLAFCNSIELAVVPAYERLHDERCQKLGLDKLRPWDTAVDLDGRKVIEAYETIEEWKDATERIFNRLNPELGAYFTTMRQDDLLDLENRPAKRPGGYNTGLPVTGKPFILMNAIGIGRDVKTLLHESGHAFHSFERFKLPNAIQRQSPMEFNEVASMAMEFLSLPYLHEKDGGFLNTEDMQRYKYDQLSSVFHGWCHMATVVLFQHWIYTNDDEAMNPDKCDDKWIELRNRFIPAVDWTGLEHYRPMRWRRQLHVFLYPFYYVEYGLARLGAVQIWMNAEENHAEALQAYRNALALGGKATLPELFSTAGADFDFSVGNMTRIIEHIEDQLAVLK